MTRRTEPANAGRRRLPDSLPARAGDGSANLMVLAKPVSGVVGDLRRTTHVFVAVTGPYSQLTALCGLGFELDSVEFLGGLDGMPCVPCMGVALSRGQRTESLSDSE